MIDQLHVIKVEFEQETAKAIRLCFATIAREIQLEAVEQLEDLRSMVGSLKEKMVSQEDEDSANQLLSLENMLLALTGELKMWSFLKIDESNNAWTCLIQAQNLARTAMQAHEISWESMEEYINYLYNLEQILFPPQIFVSPGGLILSSVCSICDSEYGDCDHIKGRPYMGEICNRIITRYRTHEISIVPVPANKLARMLTIQDGQLTRDALTWRIVPDPESEEESPVQ